MKMMKKVFSAIAIAALLASTMPAVPVSAAVSPIAGYDFENGTGMSASGIAGSTAPTVVQDAERGNVLKLAEGTGSKLMTRNTDPSIGLYDHYIQYGTPSSLKFSNPFAGKSLSGATISFWVKVPNDTAAKNASGILGFISDSKTVVHPDKLAITDGSKDQLEDAHGPYFFGISTAYVDPMGMDENPMVYFVGLHHNTYNLNDSEGIFMGNTSWQYFTLTMNNSYFTLYIDGQARETDEYKNKRWNDGEVNGGSLGNVGQTKFLTFLSWNDTVGYIGNTGFSPTSELYVDEITFYDKELSAAEVTALYQTAKSGNTVGKVGSGGGSSKEDAAKKAAEEAARKEAELQAQNKARTDAVINSLSVKGMDASASKNVTGYYRGTNEYTGTLTSLLKVILKDGYRVADFVAVDVNYNGATPATVAEISMDLPSGYDASSLVVTRLNPDGTVSILKHSVDNGKIVAKTSTFGTFAIVNMEAGTGVNPNLPKTGTVATAAVVVFGMACAASGVVLTRKKKEQE